MTEFYHGLSLVTAGLSLLIGIVSFYLGVKRGEKTYRFFAIMALCLAAFIFLPPTGFILTDKPPYEMDLLGKRIFIFIYYGLFPWFIVSFTGYKKVHVPAIISAWVAVTYCIMYATIPGSSMPVWVIFAIAAFISIFLYGMLAGAHMLTYGDKVKARWFLFAIAFFGFLLVLAIINTFAPELGIFFPLHTSAIPFMIVMGVQISMEYLSTMRE